MRHIFLSMLLCFGFWFCMACEWWIAAFITLAVLWAYFGMWVFSLMCRNWPDHSWPDNA